MNNQGNLFPSLIFQNFSTSASNQPPPPVLINPSPELPFNREPLRVLLIGSRRGVTGTIQTLYRLSFAEVQEWSPLLPAPSSGEVMSILTRYLPVN